MPLLSVRVPVKIEFSGEGYEEYVEFLANTAGGTFNYWTFEDGDQRQGPYTDIGTSATLSTLTSNNTQLSAGGMFCGSYGAPYVSGVIHPHIGAVTTPGWLSGNNIPLFNSPGAFGGFFRMGSNLEKPLLYARVANTAETVEYETTLIITSSGGLELTIETPAGTVTVTTDNVIWDDAANGRMEWHHVAFTQSGSGIVCYVDGASVATTTTLGGTTTDSTWIDDMLAYSSRDTANDVFRVLARGSNESNLDAYNNVGCGGLFVIHNAVISASDVSDLYDEASPTGAASDFTEAVKKACEANSNKWPAWWLRGSHTLVESGLNLARQADENNTIGVAGNIDAVSQVTREQGQQIDMRAAYSIGGWGGVADYVEGQSTEAGATWSNWNWSQGTIVAALRATFSGSAAGNAIVFYWGEQASGGGSSFETHFELRKKRDDGKFRFNFFYRDGATLRTWQRLFDADNEYSSGDYIVLVITHDGGSSGPTLYVNGTAVTSTDIDNDPTNTFGPDSFFDTVQGLVTVDGFRSGQYRLGGTDFGFTGDTISHLVLDDVAWSSSQVADFQTAIDSAKNFVPDGDAITLTIGTQGVTPNKEIGFEDGSHGSVSGSLSFGGGTIRELQWRQNGGSGAQEFVFDCDGVLSQNAFRVLTMETSRGFYRLHARRATFTQSGGRSRWVWTANNNWYEGYVTNDTTSVYFES